MPLEGVFADDSGGKSTKLNGIMITLYREDTNTWENKQANLNPAFSPEIRDYTLILDTTSYDTIEFIFSKAHSNQDVRAIMEEKPYFLRETEKFVTAKPHRFTKAISEFVFKVKSSDGSSTGEYKFTVERGPCIPHQLDVVNGTTNIAKPRKGDMVTITADPPPAGKVFVGWSSEDINTSYITNPVYTFKMLNQYIKVTADYEDEFYPETDTTLRYIDMIMFGYIDNDTKFAGKVPLIPSFDPNIREYTVDKTSTIHKFSYNEYMIRKMVEGQKIEVFADGVLKNDINDVKLLNPSTLVEVKVTSKDGSATGIYKIRFDKVPNTDRVCRICLPPLSTTRLINNKITARLFTDEAYRYSFLTDEYRFYNARSKVKWSVEGSLPHGRVS